VLASDGKLLDIIRQMRGHGMTSGTFERYSKRTIGYDVPMLGFNYRLDELRAAVGLIQLKRLFQWNDKRRILTKAYARALHDHCPAVQLPFLQHRGWSERNSSHHIMPILLPADVDRNDVVNRLERRGIQTSNHYPPVHRLSFYQTRFPQAHAPMTEAFAKRQLTLPLHPRMEEHDVKNVANELAQAVGCKQMEDVVS
jgi:dTDP-4-amino-4,6-dideoxygalactose transaminase